MQVDNLEKREPVFLFNKVQRKIFKLREVKKKKELDKDLKFKIQNAVQAAKKLARVGTLEHYFFENLD